MTHQPQISVIIPCYNSVETLAQTLASVFGQTLPQFEIIVIDDGSSDASAALARRLASARTGMRVISQDNNGVSAARNCGIRLARGRFIALLDADDIWEPTHLQTHVDRLTADAALGVSYSAVRFMTASGQRTTDQTRPKLTGLTAFDILCTNPCSTASSMVIRRCVFADAGFFSEELRRAEDQEWLLRVALTSWKIEGIADLLVNYRNSPVGLSSDTAGMMQGFEAMLQMASRSAPQLVRDHAPLAAARMLRYLARRTLRLKHGRRAAASYMLQATLRAPVMYLHEPRQSFSTLMAATIPGVTALLLGKAASSS